MMQPTDTNRASVIQKGILFNFGGDCGMVYTHYNEGIDKNFNRETYGSVRPSFFLLNRDILVSQIFGHFRSRDKRFTIDESPTHKYTVSMKDIELDSSEEQNLSGSLLLATPQLDHSYFEKSVILLSVHSTEDGAMGVIINRPKSLTLGELSGEFALSALSDVSVYEGGPVSSDEMILSAWKSAPGSGVFKLYFGIDQEKAEELLKEDEGIEIRAFMGYTGWTSGQLEMEIAQDSWVVSHMNKDALSDDKGSEMWRHLMQVNSPETAMLPRMPEDPSRN